MTISYELAKQLKEAGFPNINNRPLYWREPTLSELIEVVIASMPKDGRFTIERHRDGSGWLALVSEHEWKPGATPEIATAKLYLALLAHTK